MSLHIMQAETNKCPGWKRLNDREKAGDRLTIRGSGSCVI